MNIQNMLTSLPSLAAIPEKKETPRSDSAVSDGQKGSSSLLSPLAQMAYSYQLTDLAVNAKQTSFAYNNDDQSQSMKATSEIDAHLQQEKISLDFKFSAEALGLTAKDFEANGGQPIKVNFAYQQTITQVKYTSTTQIVKNLRSPQEVIGDLASALSRVMRNRGNKSVSYILDDDAMKALLSDPKIMKLMEELVLVMAAINLMKQSGPSTAYTIYVSGTGKPTVEKQENEEIQSKQVNVALSITINPPAEANPEQPVNVPETETQPAAVAV
jgi:hypothetical protein